MPVNFLCLGAQKAGTTSFFEIIKSHPDVCMSTEKEVHFFDKDENYNKGLDWYSSFFQDKEKKIVGECTPDYLLYNFVPKRIKDLLGGELKLLFILRNPIERAYSQYNFYIMNGVEFRDDFFTILEHEELDEINSYYKHWHDPAYYLSRGLYYNQIRRYMEYFPVSNMHFVLHEDLYGIEQKKHMNKILDFLGLDNFEINVSARANLSMVPKKGFNKILLKAIRKNKWLIKIFTTLFSKNIYLYIKENMLQRLEKRPNKLNDKIKIRMNNIYYKKDILQLEKLINKDLSAWLN